MLKMSIIVLITQLLQIAARTLNIEAIAKGDVFKAIWTGIVIHLSWLASIAIGSVSMANIISDFSWQYVPIVMCSLSGGLIGTYITMRKNKTK